MVLKTVAQLRASAHPNLPASTEGPRERGSFARLRSARVNGKEFHPKNGARCSTATYTASRQVRLARPSEPILLPKLRIEFADFPYLHSSID